jgi:hypothetical protein
VTFSVAAKDEKTGFFAVGAPNFAAVEIAARSGLRRSPAG